MKWSEVGFAVSAVCVAVLLASAPASAGELLFDSLTDGTSGNQDGGEFTEEGWKAPHQIWWDLGQEVTSGGMSVEVFGWNPASDSPQHQHTKQQIINMYEMPHGSPHQSDADEPKTSFFNVRTGATYDNHFKFLSSTGGFEERQETRVKCPELCIDPQEVYTLRVEWDEAGDISIYENDVLQISHQHGEPFHLRYVFLGTDNAPPGTYGPQHDVIYRNLTVWTDAVDPEPAPEAGIELTFEPNPEPTCDIAEAPPDVVEVIPTEDTPAATDFTTPGELPPDMRAVDSGMPPDLPHRAEGVPGIDESGVIIGEEWYPPKESTGCGFGPSGSGTPMSLLVLLAMLGASLLIFRRETP